MQEIITNNKNKIEIYSNKIVHDIITQIKNK